MNKIKVSIIIPVYNPGDLLINCLNSAMKQTLKDIEILCIDDGSTDNSLEILNEYCQKDARFKLFTQSNMGAGFARNKGIESAKGEYIVFLDSDDWIESDMCELLYNHATRLNTDLILFNTIRHLENNNSRDLIHFDPKNFKEDFETFIFDYHRIKDKVLNGYFGVIWSKFYKTSFLKENNIVFPKHKMYNDVEFHIKTMLLAKKIGYYPKIFYHYIRIGQSSLQTSFVGTPHALVFYDVMLGVRDFLLEFDFMDEFRKEFLNFAFYQFKTKLNEIESEYKPEYFYKIKHFFESLFMVPSDFKEINFKYQPYFVHLVNSKDYYEFNLWNTHFDGEILDPNYYKNLSKRPPLDKKINIAYVLSGFPTLSETFVLNELKWLKKNGFNVKVFSYGNPSKPVDLDFSLDVIRFDGDLINNLENLLIQHQIDLIHTHFVFPTGTKITYPLATKLKIPFTLFAHAFDIFIKENDLNNNISEISNSEYCKAIFTLSNYHKNYLMERNVPNEKIVITRQATEYNISHLSKKNNTIKNIISISRFVEKKGIDILIKAAKILENEDFNFKIYGFGPLESELKNMINELNLKNISLEGALNGPDEVKKIFEKSDLLISPCRIAKSGDRDGIPTVIFEAMANGLPVLTTNVSAIPEAVHDYDNGFVIEPNNPKLLADKLIEIRSLTPEQIFKIRKKAQDYVQEYSSTEKTMEKLLGVWSRI